MKADLEGWWWDRVKVKMPTRLAVSPYIYVPVLVAANSPVYYIVSHRWPPATIQIYKQIKITRIHETRAFVRGGVAAAGRGLLSEGFSVTNGDVLYCKQRV